MGGVSFCEGQAGMHDIKGMMVVCVHLLLQWRWGLYRRPATSFSIVCNRCFLQPCLLFTGAVWVSCCVHCCSVAGPTPGGQLCLPAWPAGSWSNLGVESLMVWKSLVYRLDRFPQQHHGHLCAFAAAVLLGPLQAASYVFQHGLLAVVLGAAWAWRASWAVSVPLGALAKVGGTLGGIGLACFTLHENLFAVLLNNVYSLVVRDAVTTFPPTPLLLPLSPLPFLHHAWVSLGLESTGNILRCANMHMSDATNRKQMMQVLQNNGCI